MPIIVSDNSPLNLLVRVNQAVVLPALFGKVIIPQEVVTEMAHPKAPEIVRQFVASMPDWIVVQSPSKPLDFPTLDAGEAAAISLALELNAPLMIDEHEGRSIARSRGLVVIGAIGILERAAEQGLIANLATVYEEVRKLRFHIAENILDESLKRFTERRLPSA